MPRSCLSATWSASSGGSVGWLVKVVGWLWRFGWLVVEVISAAANARWALLAVWGTSSGGRVSHTAETGSLREMGVPQAPAMLYVTSVL